LSSKPKYHQKRKKERKKEEKKRKERKKERKEGRKKEISLWLWELKGFFLPLVMKPKRLLMHVLSW
jgi:hypothetical protein